jgi:hypothetical protein
MQQNHTAAQKTTVQYSAVQYSKARSQEGFSFRLLKNKQQNKHYDLTNSHCKHQADQKRNSKSIQP